MHHRRIRSSTLLVLLVVLSLVVTAAGARARLHHLEDGARRQWARQLQAGASATATAVESWIADRQSDVREVALQTARQLRAGGEAGGEAGALLDAARLRRGYEAIWVVDASGTLLVSSSGAPMPQPEEHRLIGEVAHSLTERLHGPTPMPGGVARLVIATPLPSGGAVAVALDANKGLFPLLLRDGGSARTLRSKLIGRDSGGYRVLSPSVHPASEAFGLRLPAAHAPLSWELAQRGVDTTGRFGDPMGTPVLATTRRLLGTSWGLVLAVDEADALRAARLRARGELLVFLSIAGMLASVAVAVWRGAVKRRRATEALARISRRNDLILDSAGDGIIGVDAAGSVTFANRAAARMLGHAPGSMTGRPLHELVCHSRVDGRAQPLAEWRAWRAVMENTVHTADDELFGRADGTSFPVEYVATPIREHDVVFGAVIAFRDITARRELEQQLVHQAFHDTLTGLANRALFRDRVEHALNRSGRDAHQVAVLFIDLDNFKTVNDGLGHGDGDQLLTLVAQRLLSATRGCDTVARLGGDEFGVLLEDLREAEDAETVARRITDAMRAPVSLGGKEVFVGASIGIACATVGSTATELLRNADAAMYRAKAQGKGRHERYEPSMHAAALDRLELEGDLRQALDRDEFVLRYQPIIQLESGTLSSVEALVRWQHPRRGMVPPSAFITIAEETGLIVPLGRWVLREACRQVATWRDATGGPPLAVSVNLSGRQLQAPTLLDDVRDALAAADLPPSVLTLEITESVVMQNAEETLVLLRELKELGVRLAIDDFGTGYSSLSYLQRFPVDVLKIDKAFVDGVARGGTAAALARTVIALGDTLQLRTVAEGVEHAEQSHQLRALGCTHGQGYLFARPLAAEEVEQRIGVACTA